MRAFLRLLALALVAGLVVVPRADASVTSALNLRAGDVVEVAVGGTGSAPFRPTLPVAATKAGDFVAFTMRNRAGATVDGGAFLSLPGNDVAGEITLPTPTKDRLAAGRYTLTVSGRGTTVLTFRTASPMRVLAVTRSPQAMTRTRFVSAAKSVDLWSDETLPNDRSGFLVLFGGAFGNTSGFVGGLCARDDSPVDCQDPALLGSNTDKATYDNGSSRTWTTTYHVYRPGTVKADSTYDGELAVAVPTDSTFHGWALVR